jgi:hypothetical protein
MSMFQHTQLRGIWTFELKVQSKKGEKVVKYFQKYLPMSMWTESFPTLVPFPP